MESSTILNSILYFNTAPINPNFEYSLSGSPVMINCCTFPQPQKGGLNITNPPLFVNTLGGNFRLQTNSPCIDAGNSSYSTNSVDIDGRPRIVGGTVDIGAYEFQGDGMGEFIAWLQNFGLPTDGSADSTDADGDAANNLQEWRSDTIPTAQM